MCYLCARRRGRLAVTWHRCPQCKTDYCRRHASALATGQAGLTGNTTNLQCLYCEHVWTTSPSIGAVAP